MRRLGLLFALSPCVLACQADTDAPATFLAGPRVLAIKAQPPEVAPGESATLTALIAGAGGAVPVVGWARCRLAPLPGQSVNPDCLTSPQAVEALGEGLTLPVTMPADLTPDALGQPDASAGVYLPLVARAAVGDVKLTATYRLRLKGSAAANHNPTITAVFVVDALGSAPLDEAAPPVVHPGDRLTLGVSLPDGDAEAYVGPAGASLTESLTTSWFANAGDFSQEHTTAAHPHTVLSLDKRLPAPGSLIELYAVTRDERGGTDYAHRTLRLE